MPRNIKLSGQAKTGPKIKAWALNLSYILWPMSLSLGLILCLSNKFWYNILHLSFALKSLRTLSSSYFIKINHLPQNLPLYYISVNHPLLPPCYPYISLQSILSPDSMVSLGCHYEKLLLSSKLQWHSLGYKAFDRERCFPWNDNQLPCSSYRILAIVNFCHFLFSSSFESLLFPSSSWFPHRPEKLCFTPVSQSDSPEISYHFIQNSLC